MRNKGLKGDISTTVETIPEKRALLRRLALDNRYFDNVTLRDLIQGFPHDRMILIRIEVSEGGRKSEVSIVEEL